MSVALPSELGQSDHNVDFDFIGFYPGGKEQIHIAHQGVLLVPLVRDQESVLCCVLKPRFMVLKLLLQS